MKKIIWPKILILTITLIFLGLAPLLAFAGNPLYMNSDSQPLAWDTTETIKYKVDPKGLGNLSFTQSLALIQEAMAIWESVTGTNIEFEYIGKMDSQLTLQNWKQQAGSQIYSKGYGVIPAGTSESQEQGFMVIGFDNTGEIIADKGSHGASGVQSVTAIKGTLEDPLYIHSGHIFINGLYMNDNDNDIFDLSVTDMLAIVVHELGHALGMDHNVFHYEIYKRILNGTLDRSYARYLPSMFPRFIKTTGQHMITLHPDDIATLKWMYGASDYTMISGNVLDKTQSPVSTMIVTARQANSSLCQSYAQATSVTCSDMNTRADGKGANYFNAKNCTDDESEGYYEIPILEEGYYTLDVQSIPSFFGSSISKFGSDVLEIPGGAQFYNSSQKSTDGAYTFDEVLMDGDDLDDMDIVLSDTVYNEGLDLDRIDYSYFLANSFFTSLDEDIYCPQTFDYDATTEILEADIPSLESINESESSGSNGLSLDSITSGCSLNTATNSKPLNNSISSLASLIGLLGLILRHNKKTNTAS